MRLDILQEGSSDLAEKLQQVNVTVVSNSVCEEAMKPYPVTVNMMCAGGIVGQDACQVTTLLTPWMETGQGTSNYVLQGDSGGPLMGTKPENEQVYLAGVVSWGIGGHLANIETLSGMY